MYSIHFALHAITGSPVNQAIALCLLFRSVAFGIFTLKTSKQGKTKAEKLFERSEFFSAVDAVCYVFSENSVSNELFLWVAFFL